MNVLLTALTLALSSAQDQKSIDRAIYQGIDWLRSRGADFGDPNDRHCSRELVLYTLIHAGVTEKDAFFAGQFEQVLKEKPKFTYRTALRAMLLEEVDRVKYQHLIWNCAEMLVDNQSAKGDWGYGKAVPYTQIPPLSATASGGSSKKTGLRRFGSASARIKPKVVRFVQVPKRKDGGGHDNSNSQYAALGLRACHDSGIRIPPQVIERSLSYWRNCQEKEGKSAEVATGAISAAPRGWDYKTGEKPYGSMTVGAVGAMAIYLYMQDKDWKKDKNLASGAAWIAKNFAVTNNPGRGGSWHYYYLYGLERAGVLYGTETFGSHDWYLEGARYLLKSQQASGAWKNVNDTCFAILFLKRATRPLVASEDH